MISSRAARTPYVRGLVQVFDRQLTLRSLAVEGDPVARWLLGRRNVDPYPLFEKIRAGGPVNRSRTGLWVVTSRRLCEDVLRDPTWGVRTPAGGAVGSDPFLVDPPPLLGASLLDMDPPTHTRLRHAVAATFRPAVIRTWASRIEAILHQLLDQAERRPHDTIDLVGEVAEPFAIGVIGLVVGIPEVHTARFAAAGTLIGQSLGGVRSPFHASDVRHAAEELHTLLTELLAARVKHPGDDILTQLALAHAAGNLTTEDVYAFLGLLLVTGFETTVHLIANSVAALQHHPQRWRELVEQPRLATAVVEETLRWDPPVQATTRCTHTETTLDGTILPAGAMMLILTAAAHRDPAVYREPAAFDPHRSAEPDHLAFSSGDHYCLGAPLARLQGEIALQAFTQRFPTLRIVLPAARRRPGSTIRGYTTLPAQLYTR